VVPDAFDDEDDAPIELPAITPSGPDRDSQPRLRYAPVTRRDALHSRRRRGLHLDGRRVVVDQGKKGKGKKASRRRSASRSAICSAAS
jgi:hypothetical protein